MFPATNAIIGPAPTCERGVIMAAYAFGQDASLLGGLEPGDRVRKAAENLETAFPAPRSGSRLEHRKRFARTA